MAALPLQLQVLFDVRIVHTENTQKCGEMSASKDSRIYL